LKSEKGSLVSFEKHIEHIRALLKIGRCVHAAFENLIEIKNCPA